MTRILIVGASGYVGSQLSERLSGTSHELTLIHAKE